MSEKTGVWVGPVARNVRGYQIMSAVIASRGPSPSASNKDDRALI